MVDYRVNMGDVEAEHSRGDGEPDKPDVDRMVRLVLKQYLNRGFGDQKLSVVADDIEDGLKRLGLGPYLNRGLDGSQLSVIADAIEHGLTSKQIDLFADGYHDAAQMEEVAKGLEQGFDVSSYNMPREMSADDMRIMRQQVLPTCYREGVGTRILKDLIVCEDASVSNIVQMMDGLQKLRQDGVPFENFNDRQLLLLADGACEGVDYTRYLDPKLDARGMRDILYDLRYEDRGMKMRADFGIDVSQYAEYRDGVAIMDRSRLALENGVDVSDVTRYLERYRDCGFFPRQFDTIMTMMEQGFTVEQIDQFADDRHDSFQMDEVAKGMMQGVDVSIYNKPEEIDSSTMTVMRYGLLAGYDLSDDLPFAQTTAYPGITLGEILACYEAGLGDDAVGLVKRVIENESADADIYGVIHGLKQLAQDGVDCEPFNDQQVVELALGAYNDADYRQYLDPTLTPDEMRNMRVFGVSDKAQRFGAVRESEPDGRVVVKADESMSDAAEGQRNGILY